MTRMRRTSAVAVAVVLGLSLAAAGCGKYSWGALKAQKAYKDANALYRGSDWKGAAAKYEAALASDPEPSRDLFLPREQLRQPVSRPAAPGEPENDALHPEGDRELRESGRAGPEAGDEEAGAPVSRRRLRAREAERPREGRADRPEDDSDRAERAGQLLRAVEDLRGRRPVRGGRAGPDQGPRGQAERPASSTRRWPASTTARGTSPRRWKRSTRRPSSSRRTRRATSCSATYYWEKAYKDHRLSTAQKKEYIAEGHRGGRQGAGAEPGLLGGAGLQEPAAPHAGATRKPTWPSAPPCTRRPTSSATARSSSTRRRATTGAKVEFGESSADP